ncbi:MAG: DNA mismatch repair protein MutS [Firmicutes bacterium HGW-Firmicutes-15]|nr:MAG: DNA mismatch repair protein MutS [Firmicutes bacterium HGW-Firmicutes-15]
MAGYTPMIEQYLSIKKDQQDSILLFRLGDFYEMFFEDAQIASRELEIVLTARDGGGTKIPMCGVPHHAVNNYIARLIGKGYKVAICDQVEDPKQAIGIVKREVTRIITPGTILDDMMLDEGRNNYLAAVIVVEELIGFAYIDISTGSFWVTEMSGSDSQAILDSELQRVEPAECLLPAASILDSLWQDDFSRKDMLFTRINEGMTTLEEARQVLIQHFSVASLDGYGLKDYTAGVMAAGAIISFLYKTQKSRLNHIQNISVYQNRSFMELDAFTRRNLELTSSLRDGRKEGSLLAILDQCRTPMGKRSMRKWVEQPLMDIEQLNRRLDSVEELLNGLKLRQESRELLNKIYDLERLAGKLGSGIVSPRDLLALKNSLGVLPVIKEILGYCKGSLLLEIAQLDPLLEVYEILDKAIHDDPPMSIKEGGIIKEGYHEEIDEFKRLASQGKTWLIDFENREKERTGIKSLKIGFNRVFGYYIEIGNSNRTSIPQDYIRKQTLVNAERFINEELKNYEEKILGAREKLYELEYNCFLEIRDNLQNYISSILDSAGSVAVLDILASLAQVAYLNDYVRPVLSQDGKIEIKAGRHPVVEKSLQDARFVPNDIKLDNHTYRFAIITGPNMGGKSTYMRQTAILTIMAQMGSFVPADEARIGIVDRVFTRVGASDDLAAGQSTFMMEMLELAKIINSASKNSLVILDEIGRGTSTYDGLSIAQAASEFIHDKIEAKTLFATHYHELTRLADSRSGIFNLSVSVLESGEVVSFLKKVLPGKADKSYGIHVAKLAGIPNSIITRAYDILGGLEIDEGHKPKSGLEQMSLFQDDRNMVLVELEQLNIDSLSPRDALMTLYRWKEHAGK